MMIRCTRWLVALAMLVLVTGGCERQETPQVAPQPQPLPVAEEQKETAAEEAPAAVLAEEPSREDGAGPVPAEAVKPAPIEAVKPAPVEVAKPAPVQVPKPAPVEVATPQPTEVLPSAPAEEKPVKAEVAAIPQPGVVIYKASYGLVTFNHQSHAAGVACDSCHVTEPAGKIPLDKDKAHQFCRGCHQQRGAGPTQCNACHQKG